MAGEKLEELIQMKEDVLRNACCLAMEAHRCPEKPFRVKKLSGSSSMVVISFPGSWSADGWYATDGSFGETEINRNLFPSLKTIGTDTAAMVNRVFLQRFEGILEKLKIEVNSNLKEKRRIVFSGHSSGGAIAILATIWQLEKQRRSEVKTEQPLCVTFGSPLVGNFIFSHALRRENWSGTFINFTTRYDIVPIIHLSPLSSIEPEFQTVLKSFDPKSQPSTLESIARAQQASDFYTTTMRNASAIASQSACNMIGSTNLLHNTLPNFVKMSPYRPFGTFIFCTDDRYLVVVKNPEACLQALFFSKQLNAESETPTISYRSLKDHWIYENYLQLRLEPEKIVVLEKLEELPLSSLFGDAVVRSDPLAMAIDERLAASTNDVGYYDRLKLQNDPRDFQANVKRQELAGMWDEIKEMVQRFEVPDEFEGLEEWVELGTRFRRLVEPLDIANYYRHLKNEDTGPYMRSGRPRRYIFAQKWLEHARKAEGSSGESTFWAEVEELRIKTSGRGGLDETQEKALKDEVMKLGDKLKRWYEKNEIGKEVFFRGSTFVMWWNSLPQTRVSSNGRVTSVQMLHYHMFPAARLFHSHHFCMMLA